MTEPYIHVLVDPDPMGKSGQLICDECKLEGTMEDWENFLNGKWVVDVPDQEGNYPVQLGAKKTSAVYSARPSRNREGQFVWEKPTIKTQVYRRWSLPIPHPPKEE